MKSNRTGADGISGDYEMRLQLRADLSKSYIMDYDFLTLIGNYYCRKSQNALVNPFNAMLTKEMLSYSKPSINTRPTRKSKSS